MLASLFNIYIFDCSKNKGETACNSSLISGNDGCSDDDAFEIVEDFIMSYPRIMPLKK